MTIPEPRPRHVLLVSLSDPVAAPGGRGLLYRLNEAVLRDLFGDRFAVTRVAGRRTRPVAGVLRGHIDGIDSSAITAIVARIRDGAIDDVVIDGSNLGALAAAIRRGCPGVRIVTFFHNVEARFFLGALRSRPSLRALAVLIANHRAERAAVRASDVVVCLSARDSDGLRRLYGRGADAIVPMAMAEQPLADPATLPAERFALFVGGGFYANLDGIRWFARSIAPRMPIPTVVVGRGMAKSVAADRLTVIGETDDLAGWYRDAYVVIAPIRDGSGMKTKVAEALMHGKHVVGTSEAWSGYDPAVVASGWCCADADGFVAAIGEALARDLPAFDPAQRALYDRFHSFAAARARWAAIMTA